MDRSIAKVIGDAMGEHLGNVGVDEVSSADTLRMEIPTKEKGGMSPEQQRAFNAIRGMLENAGIPVEILSAEQMQQLMGQGQAVLLARISGLDKAALTIREWVKGNVRGKSFTLSLPQRVENEIRKLMGRDFDSHNITANSLAHILKGHGEKGYRLTNNSIPLRKEDLELIPYIMVAPDRIEKGSVDVIGRKSVRFRKTLSNGYVIVLEKEQKDSPHDMDTITMWAELSSSNVPDARIQNRPLNSTSQPADVTTARNPTEGTTARTVIISSDDVAKIRKDAETAMAEDVKVQLMTVYHGSGALFDAFDHSFMGTGEGAQAYGWGSYVTEVEGIGRTYAESVSGIKGNLNSLIRDLDAINAKIKTERDALGYTEVELKTAENWQVEAEIDLAEFQEKGKELKSRYGEDSYQYKNHLFYDTYTDELKKANFALSNVKKEIELRKERIEKLEKDLVDKQTEIDNYQPPSRNLYTVEIPDNTGKNYLEWDGRADKIVERVGITEEEYEAHDMVTGADVYSFLVGKFGRKWQGRCVHHRGLPVN